MITTVLTTYGPVSPPLDNYIVCILTSQSDPRVSHTSHCSKPLLLPLLWSMHVIGTWKRCFFICFVIMTSLIVTHVFDWLFNCISFIYPALCIVTYAWERLIYVKSWNVALFFCTLHAVNKPLWFFQTWSATILLVLSWRVFRCQGHLFAGTKFTFYTFVECYLPLEFLRGLTGQHPSYHGL